MENSVEFNTLLAAMTSYGLWQAIVIFISTFVIINLIKTVAGSVFQFILFKMDVFGIGSHVEYKGKSGVITNTGFRRITIKLDDNKSIIYVSTNEWKNMTLIVHNEG